MSTDAPASTITSAVYDASTNQLVVTGTNLTNGGAIDETKLTLTGQGGQTYTLTETGSITASSTTQFTITLNATDQINVEGLLNKNGASSAGGTVYNIAAAADWHGTGNADLTGNAVTVSNTQTPTITSATYNQSTGVLTVTGTNLVKQSGATNDIDLTKLTITGQGGTQALTGAVEITDATTFSVTLSGATKTAVDAKLNANGTQSSGGTTYNLSAADDWNGPITGGNIQDLTGNAITVSGINNAPTIGGITTTTTINDTATTSPFSGVTIADADGDNVTVTVTLDSSAKGVFTSASLSASGFTDSGSGVYTLASTSAAAAQTAIRQLVFDPTDNRVAAGSTETTTFTIAVNDGTTTTSSNTTTVTSTSVNDAPTLSTPTAGSYTDTAAADTFSNTSGTLSGSDVDPGATLTYGITGGTTGGSTVISSVTYDVSLAGTYGTLYVASTGPNKGKYVYVPSASAINALASGTPTDSFTVTVSDGSLSGSATFTVNITGANDTPVSTVAPAVTGTHAVGQTLTAGTGTFTDAEGASLTYSYQWYTATDSAGSGTAAIGGATGSTYALTSAEAHKYVRVAVTASDGSLTATGNSAWTQVANTAPVLTSPGTVATYTDTAAADTFATPTTGSATGTLSASDADGDTKTYGINSPTSTSANYTSGAVTYDISKTGTYGTLYVKSTTGEYIYVPTASAINALANGSNPSDSFTVTVSDGNSGSDSKTLSVGLTGANDAPTNLALAGSSVSTFDSANATVGTLQATDVDDTSWTYTITAVKDPSNNPVTNTNGAVFDLGTTGSSSTSAGSATATLRAVSPSSLSAGTYTITVQAQDAGGLGYSKDVTVTVSNSLVVTTLDNTGSNLTADGSYAADVADGGLSLWEALYYVSSGGTITFNLTDGGSVDMNSQTMTVKDNVTFDTGSISLTISNGTLNLAGGLTTTVASTRTLTISSTLADDGTVVSALTKSGAGTLVLSGTNNTASGGGTGTGLNTISVTGGTLTVTSDTNLGTGTVTLDDGTLNGNGTTFSTENAFVLGSGGGTVNVTGSSILTMTGDISGVGKLTKTNGGTLVLSGTNSYSGGTEVGGTNGISVTDSSNLGNGTVTLNTNSKLTVTGSSVTVSNAIAAAGAATITNANAVTLSGLISGTGALTKTGAGALTLSYATGSGNTQSGGWTVSAGTLVASGGKAIADSSAVTISGSGVFRVSGNETIGALTGDGSAGTDVTIDTGMTLTASYASDATMAGVIGGLGGFTKAGTGTLRLEGNNSYTGATTVSAGTLVADGSGGALADTTAVTVASGATFVVWTGETVGSVAGAGTVSLNLGTLTLGGDGTSTQISGVISGNGNLAKTGSGTLTLSGANSYAGTTTVSAGTLEVKNAAALGTTAGGTTVASGAVLTIQGGITLAEAFTLSGTGVSSSGALVNVSGTNTLSGAVTLGANTSIGTTAGTLTLDGVVSGGGNTLTKIGTGTLTMTAVNTYTGLTTVSAGTLAGTATLGGGLTVASGATLAPGVAGTNNGIGTLTVNGAFTLNGALVAELAGASSYDQVIVSGAVTLNNGTSSLSVSRVNSYTAANGATFTLIDNDASDAVSSTFTGIAESTDTTTNGDIYTVSYVGGTGNDAVLTAVVNPTVSSVSATTADGSYKAGDTISITVTFNRAVTVTGTPTLALGTGRTATYASGSGGTTLTFTYTVQAGDTSADLDYASTGALALNGGTIADSSSSLAALLTLAAPGAANSLGANKAIIIDTTAPGAPSAPDMTAGSDSGGSNTDNVTSNTTPTFTGTAEPNSTVTLYDTDGTTVLGTGTTDGSGNYSVTATTALTPGAHTLTVKARDAAGNVSSVSGGLSVTIDTGAPAAPARPALPAASDTGLSGSDGITRTTTPAITGTAEPNSTVTLYDTDGTTVLGTGTADGSGNYSVTVATALSTGPHTLTVKATDAAGNISTASPGLSVTVDTTAPTVTGVTSSTADGSYKAGDTISIQVSLSEAVIVNGTPTITLSNGRTASYSGGSGTGTLTFTYTVQAGDTAADLDYASTSALALNGGLITDTAGNDAVTTLPAVGGGSSLGGSKNIVIDTTAPTVSSVSVPTAGTYKAGDVMEFTVAFNEAVTVTGSPTLPITLDDGTVVQAAYVSGSGSPSLTFRYTVQGGLSDSDGVRLVSALSGGTITDLAGNAAVRMPGNVADTSGARIDSVAPTVTNVTAGTANGTYTTGDTVTIQVVFSEAVAVSGTPTLALNTGRSASYSGGSGSTTLTFTYTVQAGDTAADLDAVSASALAGSITDSAGNPGVLRLATPGDAGTLGGNKDIVIDTTAPSIRTIVVPNDGLYGTGRTLSVFIQTSEAVIVTGSPTITLDIGGQTRQAVYNPAASTGAILRFDYVVQAGDSDSDGIAVTGLSLNGGSITDKARIPLPTTLTGVPGLQNVLVDTVAPDTPSVPVLAPGQDSGVFATDGLTSLTRPTLGGTAEAGATVTVLVDGVAVGTTLAGADGRWSFTPTTPLTDGSHAVTSRATDPAGNSSGTSPALTLIIDSTAPVLSTPAVSGADPTATVLSTPRPTLTGSADPNSTVTVLIDGVAVGTAMTGSDGRWSFAVAAPLADGPHSVVTTATDRAGNLGRSGALSLTIDTQAPTLSAGSALTLSAGGTATLGSAVSLSDASALNRVTLTLTDARSGDELVIGALPAGITATRDGTSIVLTGVASAADYQAAVRAIGLRSSASDPSFAGAATSRSISLQARDLAGNSSAATPVTVAVARAPTTPINTTNTPVTTTPVITSGNGPSLSSGSGTGSSSNGPSFTSSSSTSLLGGTGGPSLPGSGGTGGAGTPGGSSSTDAGRSVTLSSVSGSSSSTDAGRSVTLSSVGGGSSSTDAGRSVTLSSIGGSSSTSSSSGSGLGSVLGSGLGGGLGTGGLGGSGLAGTGLAGSGLGSGLGSGGTPGGTGTTTTTGTGPGPGGVTRTGTNGQGTPGQTATPGTGQSNAQGQLQGQGQDRGTGLGTGQGRGPTAGQPGNQGQGQGPQDQGQQNQGQGEPQGQPQNQGAPQDGGGTPAERGADTRAEILPASPGFARQVARAHGGPAGAADLLAALASHVLPDSRAA